MSTRTQFNALAGLMVVGGTILAGIQLVQGAPVAEVIALAGVTYGPAATLMGRGEKTTPDTTLDA
jgi:hypothetical protein